MLREKKTNEEFKAFAFVYIACICAFANINKWQEKEK